MSKTEKLAEKKAFDLTTIISAAVKVPGVKVSREMFLREQFQNADDDMMQRILEKGPVEAGCTRSELRKKANRIIKSRTAVSTGASFLAGLPGGWGMIAAVPADILQFYGVALRMAQELVYLYGEEDLWCDSTLDSEKVTNTLIVYCGVMLGATGAAQTVRVMSSALAKQMLKKLPQQALTKHLYFRVIRSILRAFGVSLTKSTFAKGVSKIVPVVGGVVSGGVTLASMMPMGKRLVQVLDKAHFNYSEKDFEMDMQVIKDVSKGEEGEETGVGEIEVVVESVNDEDVLERIEKAKMMLDSGVITEDEFTVIKKNLIEQMS